MSNVLKGKKRAPSSDVSSSVDEGLKKASVVDVSLPKNRSFPKKIRSRKIAASPRMSPPAPFSVPLLHECDRESFQGLGLPNTVYVRKIEKSALPESLLRLLPSKKEGMNFYSVHTADGTPLALVSNRALAFSEARDHQLRPVSVH